jgi:hypothetical protein
MAKLQEIVNAIRTVPAQSVGDVVAVLRPYTCGKAGESGRDPKTNTRIARWPNLLAPAPFVPGMFRRDRLPEGYTPEACAAVLNSVVGGRARAFTGTSKADKAALPDVDAAMELAASYSGFGEPELENAEDRLVDAIVIDGYKSKGLATFGTASDRADNRAAFVALCKPATIAKWRGIVADVAERMFGEDKGGAVTTTVGASRPSASSRKASVFVEEDDELDTAAQ